MTAEQITHDMDRDRQMVERCVEAREHIVNAMRIQGLVNMLNLVLGLAIGATGLQLLNMFIDKAALGTDAGKSLFLARLSLAGVIEVFAFFFLNLYRIGSTEARYFRDELTTINLRILGLRVAIEENDKASIGHITQALGDTDRGATIARAPEKRSEQSLKVAEELMRMATKLMGSKGATSAT